MSGTFRDSYSAKRKIQEFNFFVKVHTENHVSFVCSASFWSMKKFRRNHIEKREEGRLRKVTCLSWISKYRAHTNTT